LDKPEINYPCQWPYKIIGSNSEVIKQTIRNLLENIEYQISESNRSKSGKFTSFNLSVQVDSEEERNRIFNILKSIPTVKMVM